MSTFKFAGTVKEIAVQPRDGQCYKTIYMVPDVEYSLPFKCNGISKNVVVFHPTGKWENGISYLYDDEIVFRTDSHCLLGLNIGSHYEFELKKAASEAIFNVLLQDAPSVIGEISVVKIRVV